MKTKNILKIFLLLLIVLLVVGYIFLSVSREKVSQDSTEYSNSGQATSDSAVQASDSLFFHMDSAMGIQSPENPDAVIAAPDNPNGKSSGKNQTITDTAKGTISSSTKGKALVYCPVTMLRNVPSVINAVITKGEISSVMEKLVQKVMEQNIGASEQQIRSHIRNNDIDIHERMKVAIEYDLSDFKEISSDETPVKVFGQNNSLEWEWTIKPLRTTSKSIVSFLFYYQDIKGNATHLILKIIRFQCGPIPPNIVISGKIFCLEMPGILPLRY